MLCVAGGSMGGLQALIWATQYPDYVQSVIAIATNTRHTAQQIALHEVARQAIMGDPDWQGGRLLRQIDPRARARPGADDRAHYLHERQIDGREIRT